MRDLFRAKYSALFVCAVLPLPYIFERENFTKIHLDKVRDTDFN
ncbi:hypothetical protein [Pseudoalteromonas sp. BZK2]|nr:hypothetical protein [Pseudoalteromonas sp. BZK2]